MSQKNEKTSASTKDPAARFLRNHVDWPSTAKHILLGIVATAAITTAAPAAIVHRGEGGPTSIEARRALKAIEASSDFVKQKTGTQFVLIDGRKVIDEGWRLSDLYPDDSKYETRSQTFAAAIKNDLAQRHITLPSKIIADEANWIEDSKAIHDDGNSLTHVDRAGTATILMADANESSKEAIDEFVQRDLYAEAYKHVDVDKLFFRNPALQTGEIISHGLFHEFGHTVQNAYLDYYKSPVLLSHNAFHDIAKVNMMECDADSYAALKTYAASNSPRQTVSLLKSVADLRLMPLVGAPVNLKIFKANGGADGEARSRAARQLNHLTADVLLPTNAFIDSVHYRDWTAVRSDLGAAGLSKATIDDTVITLRTKGMPGLSEDTLHTISAAMTMKYSPAMQGWKLSALQAYVMTGSVKEAVQQTANEPKSIGHSGEQQHYLTQLQSTLNSHIYNPGRMGGSSVVNAAATSTPQVMLRR